SFFELRAQFFQSNVGRICIAAIAEAVLFMAQYTVERCRGVVEVRGCQIDWRSGRHRNTLFSFAVAGVYDLRFKSHFRFQRTPSLVSSSTTPASCNPARIASARAKSRAFLAC